jgi:hypothetical protein
MNLVETLNDTTQEIRERIGGPVQLCDEDRQMMGKMNQWGVSLNGILAAGGTLQTMMVRCVEGNDDVKVQVNSVGMMVAKLGET